MQNSIENVTRKNTSNRAIQVTIFTLALVAIFAGFQYMKQPKVAPETVAPAAQSSVDRTRFMAELDAAKAGDYQAQRNVAYGFSAHPYEGQSLNPVLGCAWYLVVLNSGHSKVGPGDESNVNVYCGKLDKDAAVAARDQAARMLSEMALPR